MPGNFIRGVGFSQLNEQRWSSSAGLTTTVEHTGTYNELVSISRAAQICGYRESSLARSGEGKKVWKLRLTYVGRNPETITGGRAQVELRTSHWLASSRLENLPLWKHPSYAALVDCQMRVGTRVLKDVSSPQNIEDGIIEYERVEEAFSGQNVPTQEEFRLNITFPYSSIVQRCAEAWRNGIGGQMDENFRRIVLSIPVATGHLQVAVDRAGFVNLTKPFDLRTGMVSRVQGQGNDWFRLEPLYSYSDPVNYGSSGPLFGSSGLGLEELAQDFANNILARRDHQQWNRVTITNDRVVSEDGGTRADYRGIDQAYTSQQLIALIQYQIDDRTLARQRVGSPASCINIDATFEEVQYALGNELKDRLWIKRAPTIRQIGQGRLQVHAEWESRLFPEINPRINRRYTGPLR